MVKVEIVHVFGVNLAVPYTVHEERMNGVLRDRLACLTCKTHAFAKRNATWDAAVTLPLCEHNWLRPHRALREPAANLPNGQRYCRHSPAMAAIGLTDHVWPWEESLQYLIWVRGPSWSYEDVEPLRDDFIRISAISDLLDLYPKIVKSGLT